MGYSKDFRKKIFEIKKKEGLTNKKAASRFGISERTIYEWKHKPEPQKRRNKPASKINMEALKRDIKEKPDAYLSERAALFNVRVSTIHYAIKRLGISYKKNASSPKSRSG